MSEVTAELLRAPPEGNPWAGRQTRSAAKRGRAGWGKAWQPRPFPRTGKDLKNAPYTEHGAASTKELLGLAFDFIVCLLISWASRLLLISFCSG